MKTHATASLAAITAALLLPLIARSDMIAPGPWRPRPTPPIPTPTEPPSSSASPSPSASPSSSPVPAPNRPSPHAAAVGFEAEPPNKLTLLYAGIAVAGIADASLAALRAIGKRT